MINNNTKPNYENYRVNRYEEHSLYEDWMNKSKRQIMASGAQCRTVLVFEYIKD